MTTAAPDVRRAMIAKVKIGQKQLGWDDDTYRDILEARYGVRSATSLSDQQLADLLEHMKVSDFTPAPAKKRRARGRADRPQQGKIVALWRALWNLGELESDSAAALDAFVARQTAVSSLRWLDLEDANKVIEGLKAMCARAGFDASPPVASDREIDLFMRNRTVAAAGISVQAPQRETFESSKLKLLLIARQREILDDLGWDWIPMGRGEDLDRVIEIHGTAVRKAKAERS